MSAGDARPADLAFALLQRLLPTRLLSWLMYQLTRLESPGLVQAGIRLFLRHYPVDLAEAEREQPSAYRSFNDFFTRALKPGARPLAPEPAWLSPVDGTVSQCGAVRAGRIFQAKGHVYSAAELLADADLAAPFAQGRFCTVYLAPHNYHRIHMPLAGTLREWCYVPGRLFSVNPATARALPRLFARNERLVSIWDTAAGPLAVVLVGALFVGSMETVWAGQVTPPHRRSGVQRHQPTRPLHLPRGAELGRFNMGSTVILLAGASAVEWLPELVAGRTLRMGESLGRAPAA